MIAYKYSKIRFFLGALGVWFILANMPTVGALEHPFIHPQPPDAKFKHPTWTGTASVYAPRFQGRRTASGALYDRNKLSAAHKFLPMGTRVRVTNLRNLCSIELEVNDRLSKTSPHLIDLSPEAAKQIEIPIQGIGKVRVERISS
ncbi:MAG: septal ring lytic transglycosylase RlpA family protein [Sphingomonadales bacterium]|nr:septal ring lytic transglycosylase RlpA family protein [Sphingomonadales bacterium]MBM3924222.1 septal ring lytic transglycosylase RlpA family protein [Sphingomonadales bacterium]MBM3932387.1 septal ring lytic transglycosylase RlpA family protein [Sphingomonadales bacterium]